MSRRSKWRWALALPWLVWAPITAAGTPVGVVFYAPQARQVHIAGSFDSYWQKRHALVRRADGYWQVVLDLAPGRYEFQFLVDGVWTYDPKLPFVDDGFGGHNNVLTAPVDL